MERNVTVRTPESVDFYYELAGLGSRFMAVAIDLVLQVLVLIAVLIGVSSAAPRISDFAKTLHLNQNVIESIVIAGAILFFFFLFYGYFIIFEALSNGQTPGKRLMEIRVVRDGGYPIDFMSSLIRNLIRVVETIFGFYAISAISALVSPQNKRLGDLAAGTIVVRDRGFEVVDPKRWLRADGAVSPSTLAGVATLSADEVALARRYVERRTTLDPKAAHEAAARIASAVRSKLGAAAQGLNDDELLVRIAASDFRPR